MDTETGLDVRVWVQLSEAGLKTYDVYCGELMRIGLPAEAVKRPKSGWYTFALAELMNVFGPSARFDAPVPFVGGTIRFEPPVTFTK